MWRVKGAWMAEQWPLGLWLHSWVKPMLPWRTSESQKSRNRQGGPAGNVQPLGSPLQHFQDACF